MKKSNVIIELKMIFLATFFIGCNKDDDTTTPKTYEEIVVVANRGGGSISFIDASSNQIINTLSIPSSEPI
jgi:hypothetical protein